MSRVLDPEGAHLTSFRRLARFEGSSVIEVGCGEGRLTVGLAEEAANVFAFDPDAQAVAAAKVGMSLETAESPFGSARRALPDGRGGGSARRCDDRGRPSRRGGGRRPRRAEALLVRHGARRRLRGLSAQSPAGVDPAARGDRSPMHRPGALSHAPPPLHRLSTQGASRLSPTTRRSERREPRRTLRSCAPRRLRSSASSRPRGGSSCGRFGSCRSSTPRRSPARRRGRRR